MINQVLQLIRNHKTVAFTGAGASQESGIPTFRGTNGLWQKYDPQIYATLPQAFYTFLQDPHRMANFIIEFYRTLLNAQPNTTHYTLAKFEQAGLLCGVITQNIDNLHQFAGTRNIAELHGNAYKFFCRRCKAVYTKSRKAIEDFIDEIEKNNYPRKTLIKKVLSFLDRCSCQELLVTQVVFFGQALPEQEFARAYEFINSAEVFLCIGTSAIVYPASSLPLYAKERGCKIVEINPEPTNISSLASVTVRQPSSVFFSRFLEYLD